MTRLVPLFAIALITLTACDRHFDRKPPHNRNSPNPAGLTVPRTSVPAIEERGYWRCEPYERVETSRCLLTR